MSRCVRRAVVARGGPLIRRIRVFIDLHTLQSALDRRAGHRFQIDWPALAGWLASAAQESATGIPEVEGLQVYGIHLYSRPDTAKQPGPGGEGQVAAALDQESDLPLILTVVVAPPGECHACDKAGGSACLRCRGEVPAGSGAGVTDAMVSDLLGLTREGRLDHVVIVSEDNRLIPIVKFLRTRGTVVIHGWFPPRAIDLSRACDAFIDLGAHLWGFEV